MEVANAHTKVIETLKNVAEAERDAVVAQKR